MQRSESFSTKGERVNRTTHATTAIASLLPGPSSSRPGSVECSQWLVAPIEALLAAPFCFCSHLCSLEQWHERHMCTSDCCDKCPFTRYFAAAHAVLDSRGYPSKPHPHNVILMCDWGLEPDSVSGGEKEQEKEQDKRVEMKGSETQCFLKEQVGCGPQCRRHLEKKRKEETAS